MTVVRPPAEPSGPQDSAGLSSCGRCGIPLPGSDSADSALCLRAHISHFEVVHRADSRRRDRERLKRALSSGASPAVLVSEVAVYRRDDYRCQICGGTVLVNAPPNHPRSPSVDHIIWLSKGGNHTLENLRTSHLHCNARAGFQVKRAAIRAETRHESRAHHRREREREELRGCLVVFLLPLVIASAIGALLLLVKLVSTLLS